MQKEKHRSNATAGAYLCPQNLSQTVFDKMAYCQEDKQHILKAVIKEKKKCIEIQIANKNESNCSLVTPETLHKFRPIWEKLLKRNFFII